MHAPKPLTRPIHSKKCGTTGTLRDCILATSHSCTALLTVYGWYHVVLSRHDPESNNTSRSLNPTPPSKLTSVWVPGFLINILCCAVCCIIREYHSSATPSPLLVDCSCEIILYKPNIFPVMILLLTAIGEYGMIIGGIFRDFIPARRTPYHGLATRMRGGESQFLFCFVYICSASFFFFSVGTFFMGLLTPGPPVVFLIILFTPRGLM